VLLVWTEEMGWQRGGALCWQVFDQNDKTAAGASGRAAGIPMWSLVAAYVEPDGGFVILY
jgi:hypothetical protein